MLDQAEWFSVKDRIRQMKKEPDSIRQSASRPAALDDRDRKILTYLAQDATTPYARLAEKVALSTAATYERVKRMTRDGVIRRTTAVLDGPSIGRPLLAFILVDTDGWGRATGFGVFTSFPEIEEAHTVAGDTCLLLKVRCADTSALEVFLMKLATLELVRTTKTYISLSSYVERGPQP